MYYNRGQADEHDHDDDDDDDDQWHFYAARREGNKVRNKVVLQRNCRNFVAGQWTDRAGLLRERMWFDDVTRKKGKGLKYRVKFAPRGFAISRFEIPFAPSDNNYSRRLPGQWDNSSLLDGQSNPPTPGATAIPHRIIRLVTCDRIQIPGLLTRFYRGKHGVLTVVDISAAARRLNVRQNQNWERTIHVACYKLETISPAYARIAFTECCRTTTLDLHY